MPRPLSRPILKLPAKPALPGAADGARAPLRKPIRGGGKAAKQPVARFKPALAVPAREVAPAPAPARNAVPAQETPPRDVPLAKSYPKRGIARSTGVRALPPARAASAVSASAPGAEAARPVAAPQTAAAIAPRRQLDEAPRLAKLICEMTQCSRRAADEWIANGWVRVDGVVVTTLGARARLDATIEIKDEASRHRTESVTIVLNKPLDTAAGDEESGATAVQLIRPENRWREDESRCSFKATHLRGLAQAGKLDAGASGMLVFTQERSVARRIAGDDPRLEEEYMVRVEGELSPEGMRLLNHGLTLDDVRLKRAQVSWQNERQLRFVLHESRKRQIQRMCELVGLRVTGIKRIRIGSVALGKLPAGQWRYLRGNERF
jgi:23S rRNA pseudouridine2604 synthase